MTQTYEAVQRTDIRDEFDSLHGLMNEMYVFIIKTLQLLHSKRADEVNPERDRFYNWQGIPPTAQTRPEEKPWAESKADPGMRANALRRRYEEIREIEAMAQNMMEILRKEKSPQ
jgi:hypothetical protein